MTSTLTTSRWHKIIEKSFLTFSGLELHRPERYCNQSHHGSILCVCDYLCRFCVSRAYGVSSANKQNITTPNNNIITFHFYSRMIELQADYKSR